VGVGQLREVPAPRAAGLRGAGDPLGGRNVERRPPAASTVHGLRPQGRDAPTAELGRRRRWHDAVSSGSRVIQLRPCGGAGRSIRAAHTPPYGRGASAGGSPTLLSLPRIIQKLDGEDDQVSTLALVGAGILGGHPIRHRQFGHFPDGYFRVDQKPERGVRASLIVVAHYRTVRKCREDKRQEPDGFIDEDLSATWPEN
jgi:hypothetical protein